MNILIIGNGFDLAHKLPTKYSDFLMFCKMACKIYDDEKLDTRHYEIICLAKSGLNEEIKQQLLTVFAGRKDHRDIDDNNKIIYTFTTDYPRTDELYALIQDNVWIEYFLQCNSFLKEN